MSPVHMLLHHFTSYSLKIRLPSPGERVHALLQQHKSISLKVWSPKEWEKFMYLSVGRILSVEARISVQESWRQWKWEGNGDGRFVREMIEGSFSGNREDSREGGWPQWKHGQKVWEYQREGVLMCSKRKELPDREEKSRQLNGLNNVLLTAEMRSTSALQVP